MASKKKTYGSKGDIFRDYQIAVKFGLRQMADSGHYEEFVAALRKQNWVLEEFSREVHHLKSHYPISVGLFVDVPTRDRDGKVTGMRFVLLQHETGPEFFLQLGIEVIAAYLATAALDRLIETVRERWPGRSLRGKDAFSYVEIRTEKKGVMRIAIDDFDPTQLTCLVRDFANVAHLSDVNERCFGNLLFDPPTAGQAE